MFETHLSEICQIVSFNNLPIAPDLFRVKATSLHWTTGLYSYLFPLQNLSLYSFPCSLPSAILVSLLFLQQVRHNPVLGTLHWSSLCLESNIPSFFMAISLTSLKFLLKCHLLNSLTWASCLKLQLYCYSHSPQHLLTFAYLCLQFVGPPAPPTSVIQAPKAWEMPAT